MTENTYADSSKSQPKWVRLPGSLKAKVASLHFYPIKSCAGIDLDRAEIDERGIKDDRRWLIVDKSYSFLTQRDLPRMCLIKARVIVSNGSNRRQLELSAPEMPPLTVPEVNTPEPGGEQEHQVKIWKDECLAIDQGSESAGWLREYLGREVRLVRISENDKRAVTPKQKEFAPGPLAFQDGYPFLIISEASLEDLNRRLDEPFCSQPLPMNRFRPNIVVSGVERFEEDTWRKIKIGGITFQVDKPCPRCVITTINQTSAHPSNEPLKTLATFRLKGNEIWFGQNAIHLNSGTISINDEIEILSIGG